MGNKGFETTEGTEEYDEAGEDGSLRRAELKDTEKSFISRMKRHLFSEDYILQGWLKEINFIRDILGLELIEAPKDGSPPKGFLLEEDLGSMREEEEEEEPEEEGGVEEELKIIQEDFQMKPSDVKYATELHQISIPKNKKIEELEDGIKKGLKYIYQEGRLEEAKEVAEERLGDIIFELEMELLKATQIKPSYVCNSNFCLEDTCKFGRPLLEGDIKDGGVCPVCDESVEVLYE